MSGAVLICASQDWLRLLTARAARRPVVFAAGRGAMPPLGAVYVVAFGRLRFRAPLTARRMEYPGPGPAGVPAGGRILGLGGWRLEVDVAAAEGVTIERAFSWWPGWREVDWRGPPGPPRKGEAPTVPAADEERPWEGWRVEQMPAEIGSSAARLVMPERAVVAPVVVAAPPVKKSAVVMRGLFDGLI
jgi:hypothetical protein